MAEAHKTVHEALRRARAYEAPSTIMALAMFAAKKAVKQAIRDRGVRLANVELRAIVIAAEQFLNDHPELVDQAAETIRLSTELRTLAEREARERRRKQ